MRAILAITLLWVWSPLFAQNYTSYFTGNSNDTVINPTGGICLMGGATERDEIRMGPNPVENRIEIHLNSSGQYLEISDLTGRSILREKITEKTILLKVSSLKRGIYQLSIHSKSGIVSKNFIKN